MRLIVLAAGVAASLDGMVKCLIRHPRNGRTILELLAESFSGLDVTVVVGYRAVEVMQAFPGMRHVYNREWAVTGNAYSLALALDDSPCCVVSGDFLISRAAAEHILSGPPDSLLVAPRENRPLTAIHCVTEGDRLKETYMGPLRDIAHPEALGVFKISDPGLLRAWKANGLRHGNLFVGQTLPLDAALAPIRPVVLPRDAPFAEINTVEDYQRLMDGGNPA